MKPTDWDYDEIIRRASDPSFKDADVANLAQLLAESGDQLQSASEVKSADVPSTGGPSSMSTLICPLILSAAGLRVPKLGVPGRPAGGLDVLAQIPGYNVHLGADDAKGILDTCGYAHFVAGKFAPADAELFSRRQALGAQQVPALVIASILSKKLALSVSSICLDVRTAPSGNFGHDTAEAISNARRFCRVAAMLGITATCYVSDARLPYQPFIGRSEQLRALLTVFDERSDVWLSEHLGECVQMSVAAGAPVSLAGEVGNWKRAFEANVSAQGGTYSAFLDTCERSENSPFFVVEAGRDGFPHYDMSVIRNALVECQRRSNALQRYPDPVGVTLLAEPFRSISSGTPVARVRHSLDISEQSLRVALASAFKQGERQTRTKGIVVSE